MIINKFKTAFDLGLINIFHVIYYRLMLRSSLHPVCRIHSDIPKGPFFLKSELPSINLPEISSWKQSSKLFSFFELPLNKEPPNWLSNPLDHSATNFPLIDWWKISDFEPKMGDIKMVWEQSRMDWVIAFAQRARNGDSEALSYLNHWIADWLNSNPPYLGPNWKCGQESSIRVINLACAALILGQEMKISKSLNSLISLHLKRISPTINYAIAQDNNHGTSEAAALMVGGSLLIAAGDKTGFRWEKQGRYWLENRVNSLIHSDGSFSQYSLNYHRMLVDTLSFSELWRQKMNLKPFSLHFYEKSLSAIKWIYQMISPISGDGPNIGSNDGSRLLQITDANYRDYRPSIQLAMAVFQNINAYPNHLFSQYHLDWLGINHGIEAPPDYCNCEFSEGGFNILREESSFVMFRYPQFNFRPSQADALHTDFWVNGVSLLSDAGTYSYNHSSLSHYFSGTSAHNTIEFDYRDQMPRLSRFLFMNWLRTHDYQSILSQDSEHNCAGGYYDFTGANHHRSISLSKKKLKVVDWVGGFKKTAILRWRLTNTDWKIIIEPEFIALTNGLHKLEVRANVPIKRAIILDGLSSLHYFKKESTPVLEVEINQSGKLTSEYFL
ncbi:heparinase II/III-family protein [Gammaproteobacteria bacterium]|nr:heparinase II/III-family protein [Gammaproteobacteria bacterium]